MYIHTYNVYNIHFLCRPSDIQIPKPRKKLWQSCAGGRGQGEREKGKVITYIYVCVHIMYKLTARKERVHNQKFRRFRWAISLLRFDCMYNCIRKCIYWVVRQSVEDHVFCATLEHTLNRNNSTVQNRLNIFAPSNSCATKWFMETYTSTPNPLPLMKF